MTFTKWIKRVEILLLFTWETSNSYTTVLNHGINDHAFTVIELQVHLRDLAPLDFCTSKVEIYPLSCGGEPLEKWCGCFKYNRKMCKVEYVWNNAICLHVYETHFRNISYCTKVENICHLLGDIYIKLSVLKFNNIFYKPCYDRTVLLYVYNFGFQICFVRRHSSVNGNLYTSGCINADVSC